MSKSKRANPQGARFEIREIRKIVSIGMVTGWTLRSSGGEPLSGPVRCK